MIWEKYHKISFTLLSNISILIPVNGGLGMGLTCNIDGAQNGDPIRHLILWFYCFYTERPLNTA